MAIIDKLGKPGGPYGGSVGVVAGSSTSEAAGASMAGAAGILRVRIYQWLAQQGAYGATDFEIDAAFKMATPTRPRRRELVVSGECWDSGHTRLNIVTGRRATVWTTIRPAAADDEVTTDCPTCGSHLRGARAKAVIEQFNGVSVWRVRID